MTKPAALKGLSQFKNPLILLPILLVVFVFISLVVLPKIKKEKATITEGQAKVDQIFASADSQAFSKLTGEIGPQKAYEIIKVKFPNNDAAAHDFAHIIGIVAHDLHGIENLKICDTAYNYGCYHGFIEAFIAKNTVAKVASIEDGCIALGPVHAPSCLHGIGHGVMVDASYNLDTALENCASLKVTSQIYCWDGVFMERIVGSMLTQKDKFIMTQQTLREPCDSVTTIYKEQCWRNQVASWLPFFGGNTQEVGNQCALTELEYQKTCFESLGLLVTITVGENASQIINSCTLADNQISDDCLVGAMKELLFEGKKADIAARLCNAVSRPARDYCHQTYSDHLSQSQARFGR